MFTAAKLKLHFPFHSVHTCSLKFLLGWNCWFHLKTDRFSLWEGLCDPMDTQSHSGIKNTRKHQKLPKALFYKEAAVSELRGGRKGKKNLCVLERDLQRLTFSPVKFVCHCVRKGERLRIFAFHTSQGRNTSLLLIPTKHLYSHNKSWGRSERGRI